MFSIDTPRKKRFNHKEHKGHKEDFHHRDTEFTEERNFTMKDTKGFEFFLLKNFVLFVINFFSSS